ncbi:MAG: hypothetical protein JXQ69_03980 [Paludibacteraceae bacterium]|nr:hypothetical protein [Paludibacteraceae bacterium]MBN2787465.1 hypothetical protein [Paludibacteraceae bacterium]
MKRKFLFISAIALSVNLFAQTSVNKTTVEIPKDYKKGNIVSTNLNDNSQLEIVLGVNEKKEVKLFQYTFDINATKVDEKEIQYDVYKTKNKELPKDGKQNLARFVRVAMSSNFLGSMTLEKGYIEKTYVDGRFIGESFQSESTYKIKTDDNRNIVPIDYINVAENSVTTHDLGLSPSAFLASGDLIAVGAVEGKLVTKGRMGVGTVDSPIDYCVIKASAKTLEVEKKKIIEFKYVQKTEICKSIIGNRIMLITKDYPTPYKGSEEFYNKGSNLRTVTIINKDAEVESQYTFEGLPDLELISAEMKENGNLYIIARVGKKKEMSIVAIKLANKKLAYIQPTLLSEMEGIVAKPSDEKKHKLFSEDFPNITVKTRTYKGIIELNNKHFVAIYQDGDKAGRMYYLQFNESGKLLKHYTHSTKEELTAFDGNIWRPIQLSMKQADNNVFYPIICEIKKEGIYYSICKIDGNNNTISDLISFGMATEEDKNEYFLDKEYPLVDTKDGGIILIGRTKDKGLLWVNKIKFE